MNTNEIPGRMAAIMRVFMWARSLAESVDEFPLLEQQLEGTENEFRSVAYEAASMAIASAGFENGNGLTRWKAFCKRNGDRHAAQIHAGLGWAAAQNEIPVSSIMTDLPSLMQYRMLDGCGYYDGIFRRPSTLANKIGPEQYLDFLPGYDQGIGRSFYYSAKGHIEKIPALISEFPDNRQADMWRGVAIACVYVGGFDEDLLNRLADLSGTFFPQLQVGAAIASRARNDAGSVTSYAQLACSKWCHLAFSQLVAITYKTENSIGDNVNIYNSWTTAISKEILLQQAVGEKHNA